MKIRCPKCSHMFTVDSRRKDGHSNVFHAIVGEWCKDMGEGFETVRARWKYHYGEWLPFPFTRGAPAWPGQFYEIDNQIVFLKSSTAYTRDEMKELCRGAKSECFDAGVDLAILDEYEKRKKMEAAKHGHTENLCQPGDIRTGGSDPV